MNESALPEDPPFGVHIPLLMVVPSAHICEEHTPMLTKLGEAHTRIVMDTVEVAGDGPIAFEAVTQNVYVPDGSPLTVIGDVVAFCVKPAGLLVMVYHSLNPGESESKPTMIVGLAEIGWCAYA